MERESEKERLKEKITKGLSQRQREGAITRGKDSEKEREADKQIHIHAF